MCMVEVPVSPDLTPGNERSCMCHIHDRSFLHVRSGETDTSNTHIDDRSFPGVRSAETDTSNTHIHDRSFPHVRSVETDTTSREEMSGHVCVC
jgi:hypothetical protein